MINRIPPPQSPIHTSLGSFDNNSNYNISGVLTGFQTELSQLQSNASSFMNSAFPAYLQGTLSLILNLLNAQTPIPKGAITAFNQLQQDWKQITADAATVPPTTPSTSLIKQVMQDTTALITAASGLTYTGQALTNGIHATIADLQTEAESPHFPQDPTTLNTFIGVICGLENISVFQGPPEPNGYRPITDANLSKLNDSAIVLTNFAFSKDPSDQSHAAALVTSIQDSLTALSKESWN